MTITITKTDGSVVVFTDVTNYTNNGVIVSFTGKRQSDGVSGDWEFNWSEIESILKQKP